ncbi:hypothetical protein [Paenibacillus sp. NPDC057967]|uniref:hypothetical protein n=1 Tax=Paenibacillus sp. NPDC057967 TaxID=3346293 RepID=UPI0036DF1AB4
MLKSWKRTTAVTILSLIVMIAASLTALAAGERTFETVSGAKVKISNIIETRQIEDVGYGETMYVVQAPVKITFEGELLTEETWVAKWEDEESLEYVEIVNNSVTLTDPVEYGIFPAFKGENRSDNKPILLLVVDGKQPVDTSKETESLMAKPASAKVVVNGKEVVFEAYNINGNNYFKLRDLAMALNGSEKSFAVDWDSKANAISLKSATKYTPVGNELALSESSTPQKAAETSSTIFLDGKEVTFVAYKINGNNYFKLRDVAQAFNIGVNWIQETKTIGIDTSADYKEE